MGEQVMNLLDGNNIPTLNIIFLLTIIALLPSIVVMVTSFTRIIIILSFLRNAMGIQQVPPNVVLAGLSLFLTLFIMGPTLNQINVQAYLPYRQEQITQEEALKRTTVYASANRERYVKYVFRYGRSGAYGQGGGLTVDGDCAIFYD